MFKTRLLSGIVLVAAALLLILTGGDVLLASTCVISLIGMFELYRIVGIEKSAAAFTAYAATVFYYAYLRFGWQLEPLMLILVFMILLLVVYVVCYPRYQAAQIWLAFFGVFYVAVMLSAVYHTRMMDGGAWLVWLIFICSWGCDTCAYCAGRLFGKHKMAPQLSPKKTVEGAVGGLVGVFLLTWIYCTVFKSRIGITSLQVLYMAVISVAGGLLSMVGDLAASAIKRNYDVKDYGTLIPGHGGILDRFDSVIFTAPVIYYLAKLCL